MLDENASDVQLIATLNDMLQLDHDALEAYTVAVDHLRSEQLRGTIIAFRGDHERHVAGLTTLVLARGGKPMEMPHVPTGFFKLGVQKAATAGGDRELLLAFKANEGQVRDKYRRMSAEELDMEASALIRRNAADEERHYAWVTQALEALGAGAATTVGRVEAGFETVHGRTADAIEAGERAVMVAADATRERVAGLGERARDTVSELGESARDVAAHVGDRALSAAGSGLEGAARGLDRAAEWAEDRGGVASRAAVPVRRIADVLEQEGVHLTEQDLDAVKRDVEGGVRAHPIRSVLLAAGVGYVVGRMLR